MKNAAGSTTIANGDRVVSDSFLWKPNDKSKHYCLIGVVTTDYFATNDPTTIQPGNWQSATWIQYDGSAAWHNMEWGRQTTLTFYNQDRRPERFAFHVIAQGLPQGSTVTLAPHDSKLHDDLVFACVTRGAVEADYRETTLAANYRGKVDLRVDVPDGPHIPPNASVTVKYHWVVDRNHPRYPDAAVTFARHRSREGDELRIPLGEFVLGIR